MSSSGEKSVAAASGRSSSATTEKPSKSKYKGAPSTPLNADLMHPNYLKKDLDYIEEKQSDLEGSQGTSRAMSNMHESCSSLQTYTKKGRKRHLT